MENLDPNAQSLLAECRRGADWLSRILCMFFPGVAAIIVAMLHRDFIDSATAHSAWGLCAIALIGLGILQSKHRNLPTVLGTMIAVLAATYIFFHVASAHPEQWIFLGWAFGMFGMMIWTFLVLFGIDLSERAAALYGWPWRIVGMIWVMAVFCAPFGLVVLLAGRG